MKRGVLLVSFVFLLMLVSLVVAASHSDSGDDGGFDDGAGEDAQLSPLTDERPGLGIEIYSDISDSDVQEAKERIEGSAGITPDSALYGITEFFKRPGDDPEKALAYKEEKIAEAKEMVEEGNIEAAKIALKKAEVHSEILEKEVSPEIEEKVRESSKASEEILKEIKEKTDDEELKDDIDNQSNKETEIALAASIANKIKGLCDQLLELGAYKEAGKVCKGGDDDAPGWLKKEDYRGKISEGGQQFFKVLEQCITGECDCNDMPGEEQVDLCLRINEADEAGEDPGDLIDEFRASLPDDLKDVMDRAMERFEEVGFENRKPPQCAGVDTFRECMAIMAEEHLQNAPEACRAPIRAAIRSGEVSGERDARGICEAIMFKENAPPGCEGLSPDECGDKYGRGRPAGLDFGECDVIEDELAILNCFDDHADNRRDYQREKRDFRNDFDFRGEGNFQGEFEARYAREHEGELDYEKYYRNDEDAYRRFEQTKQGELACVQKCSSNGEAWGYSNGQCRCFGGGDFNDFGGDPYSQYPGDGQYPQPGQYPGDDGRYPSDDSNVCPTFVPQCNTGETPNYFNGCPSCEGGPSLSPEPYPGSEPFPQPGEPYPDPNLSPPPSDTTSPPPEESSPPPEEQSPPPEESSPPPEEQSPPPEENSSPPITGGVIRNSFLDYYFGK